MRIQKWIALLFIGGLLMLSTAACENGDIETGREDVTTAEVEVETTTPAATDTETDDEMTASSSQAETETPGEELTDLHSDYLLWMDFDNVTNLREQCPKGFYMSFAGGMPYTLVSGSDGYIKNSTDDGYVFLEDKEQVLQNRDFLFETEIVFHSMPVERESNKGKGSYPLSVMSWIRKGADGSAYYDYAFKMDGDGYIYMVSNKHTGVKLETDTKYQITVSCTASGEMQVYVDGKRIGSKTFVPAELSSSILRLMDVSRAHFDVELHRISVRYSDADSTLPQNAQRSLEEAARGSYDGVYFAGYTNKDALSYAVGEEIQTEIYLIYKGETVSVPYFYYTVEGEDGQPLTEGYAYGAAGHFTVRAKMDTPGCVLITAYMCDENKQKIHTNVVYRGGAAAGASEITVAGKIPEDLADYWGKVFDQCCGTDIALLRFEEVPVSKFSYNPNKWEVYLFEIDCGDGMISTGYITYPRDAKDVKLQVRLKGYGNTRAATPWFREGFATAEILAHSYHMDDPNPPYPPVRYGFDPEENKHPDTVYFHGMFVRNIMGVRLLKAFAGDSRYGSLLLNGEVIPGREAWQEGEDFFAIGGSQGGFQAIAYCAMDSDVTDVSIELPWFCDIGGQTIGRYKGLLKPDYTDALMYYDTCAMATLIEKDVTVDITAGLGDRTCPPSGILALYNALNCTKSLKAFQNVDHSYTPPATTSYMMKSEP